MRAARSLVPMTQNRSMPPGTIIPELVYDDVATAAKWLCETFGFRERLRIGDHRSQLVFGGSSLIVVARGGGRASRPSRGGVTHGLMVRVEDVDRHFERAKERGANVLSAPETFPFGERQYTVEDIGGHRWTFTESVADVAPEEWGGRRAGAGNP